MIPVKNNFAFIDGQNLNLGIQTLGWKLDYKKFRIYLSEKYFITKAYIFIGYIESNKKLYENLISHGYILVFKDIGKSKNIKGNVDAEMILHSLIKLPVFDRALIITGDGDFLCLIEYLIGIGKFLKILIPSHKKYSYLFNSLATSITNVADFIGYHKNKLEYKVKSS